MRNCYKDEDMHSQTRPIRDFRIPVETPSYV